MQYLSIAAYFEREHLPELAAFFYRQAEEERLHAMKFLRYITEAGGHVRIPAIPAPQHDFSSAEECARLALEWELEVTRQINALMDLAIEEGDHIAQDFLRWFVTEQLEEVSTMESLLAVIRRAGEQGLLFVEDYLARGALNPHPGGTEQGNTAP